MGVLPNGVDVIVRLNLSILHQHHLEWAAVVGVGAVEGEGAAVSTHHPIIPVDPLTAGQVEQLSCIGDSPDELHLGVFRKI